MAKKTTTKKTETAATAGVPGLNVGLKSGVGVTATWNKLLGENVKAKLTDEQLQAAFKKDFPQRDYLQPIGRVRSFYNTGRYGFGKGEGVRLEGADRSVAYDENGEPIKRQPFGKPAKPAAKKAKPKARRKTTTTK